MGPDFLLTRRKKPKFILWPCSKFVRASKRMSQSSMEGEFSDELRKELKEKEEGEVQMDLDSPSKIWETIELSESCMVSCMFEEAASLSSSVIKHIYTTSSMGVLDKRELSEMVESAGMVLIQSLKQSGRTLELFEKLELLFSSVAEIPVNILIEGVCMQLSEGYSSKVKASLEEFLDRWRYLSSEGYALPKGEQGSSNHEGYGDKFIKVSKYFEVADLYAVTLVGTILGSPDLAITWVQRAELPEQTRQDMLSRLHSLKHVKESSSSLAPQTSIMRDGISNLSSSSTDSEVSKREDLPEIDKAKLNTNGDLSKRTTFGSGQSTLKHIPSWISPWSWWYHTIHLKSGYTTLSFRKVLLLLSLVFFYHYVLRKRRNIRLGRETVKRVFSRQIARIRKALFDAWHLAFSFQVNPLAAVQPLPSVPQGSR